MDDSNHIEKCKNLDVFTTLLQSSADFQEQINAHTLVQAKEEIDEPEI